jgi:hypothetical protein
LKKYKFIKILCYVILFSIFFVYLIQAKNYFINENSVKGTNPIVFKSRIDEIINLNLNGNFIFFPLTNLNYLVFEDHKSKYTGSNFLYKYLEYNSYPGYESLSYKHDEIKGNILQKKYDYLCNAILNNRIKYVIFNKNISSDSINLYSYHNKGDLFFDENDEIFDVIVDKKIINETYNYRIYKINQNLNFSLIRNISENRNTCNSNMINYEIDNNIVQFYPLNEDSYIINLNNSLYNVKFIKTNECDNVEISRSGNNYLLTNIKNCKKINFQYNKVFFDNFPLLTKILLLILLLLYFIIKK